MPTARQILVLRQVLIEGKSVTQIAKALGVAPSSVRESLIKCCIYLMPELKGHLHDFVDHQDRGGGHRLRHIYDHREKLLAALERTRTPGLNTLKAWHTTRGDHDPMVTINATSPPLNISGNYTARQLRAIARQLVIIANDAEQGMHGEATYAIKD